MRIPWQIYPQESVRLHEEGTVTMQLIFDADWGVRKATVLQSSGYYRLNYVSLQFVMTTKYSFKVTQLIDGEPTITIPIAWAQASESDHVPRQISDSEFIETALALADAQPEVKGTDN